MRNVTFNVDVEIDLTYMLSDKAKQEFMDELYDDGFRPKQMKISCSTDFDELISKIIGNKHQLTIDEERIICEIAERIVL